MSFHIVAFAYSLQHGEQNWVIARVDTGAISDHDKSCGSGYFQYMGLP